MSGKHLVLLDSPGKSLRRSASLSIIVSLFDALSHVMLTIYKV